MRAVILLLVLLGLTASTAAQPQWSPNNGWRVEDDFDARARDMREAHEARAKAMRDDFEATSRRMDDDFNRTTRWMFGGFAVFAVLLFGIAGISHAMKKRREPVYSPPLEYAPVTAYSPSMIDVSVLRIAVDGRASKFVQTELEAIMKAHAESSAEGRARRLREVSVILRRVRDSWVYGGADNDPVRARDEALQAFARYVDDARTRVKQPPTQVTPPSRDAVGLILVSIIVAARGELMTVTDLATGEDLRRALEAAVHRAADDIIAVDIVWAPAESGKSLSSVELESHYRKSELHPIGGALVGKLFCKYCNGPFPAELVTCPHCGAPAREQRAS